MVTDALCVGLKPFVSSTVRIECPTPPDTVNVLPFIDGNEWITERSGVEGLEKASQFVYEQIDEMKYQFDIDTEDIVLVGLSEGGFIHCPYCPIQTRRNNWNYYISAISG